MSSNKQFISADHIAERVGDIGNEPLSESDARIAAVIANFLGDLAFQDELSAAILAVASVRYYDKPENADTPAKLLEQYKARQKDTRRAEQA